MVEKSDEKHTYKGPPIKMPHSFHLSSRPPLLHLSHSLASLPSRSQNGGAPSRIHRLSFLCTPQDLGLFASSSFDWSARLWHMVGRWGTRLLTCLQCCISSAQLPQTSVNDFFRHRHDCDCPHCPSIFPFPTDHPLIFSLSLSLSLLLHHHRHHHQHSPADPLHVFDDFSDSVLDVQWAPAHPALLCTADASGSLALWNLNRNTEVSTFRFFPLYITLGSACCWAAQSPLYRTQPGDDAAGDALTTSTMVSVQAPIGTGVRPAINHCRWNADGRLIAAADTAGVLTVYRIEDSVWRGSAGIFLLKWLL